MHTAVALLRVGLPREREREKLSAKFLELIQESTNLYIYTHTRIPSFQQASEYNTRVAYSKESIQYIPHNLSDFSAKIDILKSARTIFTKALSTTDIRVCEISVRGERRARENSVKNLHI